MTFTDEANSSTLKLITLDVNKSLTKILSADTYIGSVLLRAVNSGVQHPIIVYWQLIILNLQPTHSLVVTQSLTRLRCLVKNKARNLSMKITRSEKEEIAVVFGKKIWIVLDRWKTNLYDLSNLNPKLR